MNNRYLKLWAFGDAHVGTDLKRGRESLVDALRDSENAESFDGEPFEWDAAVDIGGNPAGVVSGETFDWWKHKVETNPNSIIVSVHHYMLKDTTVASGEWEGIGKDKEGNWCDAGYHGYFPQGTPQGASYLYYVDSKPDAQAFEQYLAENPGAVDIWLGGHTHAHPDDDCGGKAHVEQKWGTWFINASCLSRYHGATNVPKSRLLTFKAGSPEVRVQCFMHTDEFLPKGWYHAAERCLTLSRPFVPAGRLAAPGTKTSAEDNVDKPGSGKGA